MYAAITVYKVSKDEPPRLSRLGAPFGYLPKSILSTSI